MHREHPFTFAGALAEETVRDLLLSELERIRETSVEDPDEAERLVRRLSSVRWPSKVKRLWGDSRDLMLETIAARRAPGDSMSRTDPRSAGSSTTRKSIGSASSRASSRDGWTLVDQRSPSHDEPRDST